jgi:hypothetical protein
VQDREEDEMKASRMTGIVGIAALMPALDTTRPSAT